MNTSDLIDHIATVADCPKTDAKKILEAVLDGIVTSAKNGDDVSLTGFGKFSVRHTAARKGRNPATGAEIDIPASRKLAFTPGKAVKDALSPPAAAGKKAPAKKAPARK